MAAFLKTISMPVPWAAALLLILLGAHGGAGPGEYGRGSGAPASGIGDAAAGCGAAGIRADCDARAGSEPADRLLYKGLLVRRGRNAGRRSGLAGNAPVAQPRLGPSGPDRIPAAPGSRRRNRRVARVADRRHGSAARWPDAYRACFASARHRKRHLADANAGSPSRSRSSATRCRPPASSPKTVRTLTPLYGVPSTASCSSWRLAIPLWTASS